jgi:hypothetical protein
MIAIACPLRIRQIRSSRLGKELSIRKSEKMASLNTGLVE